MDEVEIADLVVEVIGLNLENQPMVMSLLEILEEAGAILEAAAYEVAKGMVVDATDLVEVAILVLRDGYSDGVHA